jgi:hypothetical protein
MRWTQRGRHPSVCNPLHYLQRNAYSLGMDSLQALIGEWTISAPAFPGPPGRAKFEWMPGGKFLVEHWDVGTIRFGEEDIEFTGIAIMEFDSENQNYLQHYFDSRGVARVYQMSFADGVWKLWRDSADFSPLDFSQRFTGTVSDDGQTIEGRWEISHDGTTWETDFDVIYTKTS